MATYAAKTGTQNFSDTWAVIDATSANLTEGGVATFTNTTTSYVSSSVTFTPGVITVDGVGVYIAKTNFNTTYPVNGTAYSLGTFSIRLATGGNLVAGTEVTVNVEKLAPRSFPNYDLNDKIMGGWVFIKFDNPVTLAAATAYTLDIKSSIASSVQVGTSGAAGTAAWMRFLRTTATGTPAATERLFICGELSSSSTWSTNTVNHNSTDSSTSYGRVDIGAYGSWIWNNAASTNYYFKTSGDIRVGCWGTIQIGTSASPIPATSTAVIEFVSASGAGCTLYCSKRSTITMCGIEKTYMGYLQSNINANVSTATVSASSSSLVDPGWKNGDICVLAVYGATNATYITDFQKADEVTLNSNSTNGVITWSTSKNWSGSSQATTWYQHSTTQPWVANLTRNVKIRGSSATNTFQFSVNTDLINLTAVEMYYVDALRLRCGDNEAHRLIKNCVIRDTRGVAISQSAGAGGFYLLDSWNITVENCVVSRGCGFAATSIAYDNLECGLNPAVFKNCIAINMVQTAVNAIQCNTRMPTVFDGCIVTSGYTATNFYQQQNHQNVELLKIQNCIFGYGMYQGYFTFTGAVFNSNNNYFYYFNGYNPYLKITNCTFYHLPVNLSGQAFRFDDCTLIRFYQSAFNEAFVSTQATSATGVSGSYEFPNIFNNCVFSGANFNLPLFSGNMGHVIVNGGSTDCGSVSSVAALSNKKIVFNNFLCPNFTLTTTYNSSAFDQSPGCYSPSSIGIANGNSDGYIKFQRYNGVEGDHRTYGGTYQIFTDSTTYDSSPRSMKVFCRRPTGDNIIPIKVPLKKNQTATISFKVKLSEPQAVYSATKFNTSFVGKVPAIYIKANRALGSNYNNDILYYPSSDLNGLPDVGFTPASLGTNLRLWLDCTSLSDITYDSTTLRVSQWNDKSGLGNHLTQSTYEKKPIVTMAFGNYHGGNPISFKGMQNQRLVVSSNILNGTTAEMELFMVYQHKNNYLRSSGEYFGFGDTTPMVAYNISTNSGSSEHPSQIVCGVGRSGNTLIGPGLATNSRESACNENSISLYHLTNSVANSQRRANLNGYRFGSTSAGAQDATAVNITPTNFSLGASQESTSDTSNQYGSATFDVYEIIVVNKKMSDTEIDNMNKYLCNKWNIALRSATTSWKTLNYTLPSVTDDTVVEAWIQAAGGHTGNIGTNNFAAGHFNIDTIKVT